MRYLRPAAAALSIALVVSASVHADDKKSFVETVISSAGSSAGSKGGEAAVKIVSGLIYGASCATPGQRNGDPVSKTLCDALGSLSGKAEEEWKANVEKNLKEINDKLATIESTQKKIDDRIRQQHSEALARFDALPGEVRATAVLTTVDNLWRTYINMMRNPRTLMTKRDLQKFAHTVAEARLNGELGDLNSLLAHSINGRRPLLAEPFHLHRIAKSPLAPPQNYTGLETYDFAEQKFMQTRGEIEKGYIVYLWAAEIIQSECELKNDEQCAALPISSTHFAAEFKRWSEEQFAAFASGANSLVLSYSYPEVVNPHFIIPSSEADAILARVNILGATMFGSPNTVWGEVISADGDPWEKRVSLQCNGTTTAVAPIVSYTVAADTKNGKSIDWWSSRARNGVYDEVHFTPNWRIYHYAVDNASPGPCRILSALPNGQKLPWTAEDGQVVNVPRGDETQTAGFFYAIQRAGGTYALASGADWKYENPFTADSGDATKKDTRFDWSITAGHPAGLWAGILNVARVEHTVGKSIINNNQDAKVHNRIYAYDRKTIYFPEGGPVILYFGQDAACAKVCRTGVTDNAIIDYDVENSPYEAGKLKAIVAVFLDPSEGIDNVDDRAKNGIFLDGSYKDSKERNKLEKAKQTSGKARVNPGTGYHLQYLIDFDLVTHTKRLDSTSYRFLGKLTPDTLYLTK